MNKHKIKMIIARALEIDEYTAFDMIDVIVQNNLVIGLSNLVPEDIEKAKKLIPDPMEGLIKIMMWAINKCPDITIAEKAFKQALKVKKLMSKK